jgi:hypothetical protein
MEPKRLKSITLWIKLEKCGTCAWRTIKNDGRGLQLFLLG